MARTVAVDKGRLLARLRRDAPFLGEKALRITTKRGELVPLVARPAQLKLQAALEAQRAAGRPRRAIVLKARQTGISTWTQALIAQDVFLRPRRHARVIAHDDETAGSLFGIARLMWEELPAEIRPREVAARRGKYLELVSRSSLKVDTARDWEGGRGMTIHDAHCSELAFWPQPEKKLLALKNAVPRDEDTLVVLESTANGHNYFKEEWDRAAAGESDYAPVFVAWFDEPDYRIEFPSAEERARFEESVGDGPFGEDEPRLLEAGLELEQLLWRRWCIANNCDGSLEKFRQEYPSSPEEAFIATGARVFSPLRVRAIIDRCGAAARPERGRLDAGSRRRFRTVAGVLDVPASPRWTPGGGGFWRVWEHPFVPSEEERAQGRVEGRYVIGVDVSQGQPDGAKEPAWHAIQVIDHRSRVQCAEYRSRVDLDVLAEHAYLAALWWNRAWLAVEVTGIGLPVARIVQRDFRYPFLYVRRRLDRAMHDKLEDRLGWDTNRVTKPLLEEHAVRLVREGLDGVRSEGLAREMLTYVRDERGRTGPERGQFSDRLMAWMIAQYVALELPIRRDEGVKTGEAARFWTPRNKKTGY